MTNYLWYLEEEADDYLADINKANINIREVII